MVNSYSLSDDSGVMAAAAITHFLFGQAVFSYLNGVLGIFRPKTTKCSGGRAVRGLQRGITFR